ncbi:hypothetical protein [Pseudomonas sp.]|uniref:hypothetical protein n=1 Tax=Pseudomonas sp. TaxID=306 RepID=UPI00290C8CEA|nr:hypothetical protein [Pseudomonas sp.]MDU4249870.1 hypothetical protein [Pseudomonas sp.]
MTGNYLDLASYISVPAEMQEETTKVEKISTKRARLLKAPNILLVIGCITVYLSYSGWFSLSLPSAAVSAIFGLYIAFKHIRELELGSKLGKAKSPWARVFLFMLSGYIYFSIIGYGVIYPIHALLGKKRAKP